MTFRLPGRGRTHHAAPPLLPGLQPGACHRRLRVRRLASHLPDHRSMYFVAFILQAAAQPKFYYHRRLRIWQLTFRLPGRGRTYPPAPLLLPSVQPGVCRQRLWARRLAFHLPDHRSIYFVAFILQSAPQPKTYYHRRLRIWQLTFRLPGRGRMHPAAALLQPLPP